MLGKELMKDRHMSRKNETIDEVDFRTLYIYSGALGMKMINDYPVITNETVSSLAAIRKTVKKDICWNCTRLFDNPILVEREVMDTRLSKEKRNKIMMKVSMVKIVPKEITGTPCEGCLVLMLKQEYTRVVKAMVEEVAIKEAMMRYLIRTLPYKLIKKNKRKKKNNRRKKDD